MRLLVVGCNGQLGQEIRRCLEGMSSEMGPIPAAYERAQADYIDIDDVDISDAHSVHAWFAGHPAYDVVVNCAAMTNVDGCEAAEAAAYKANAIGPMNLAKAAAGQGAKFVHISTDYVFPGTDPTPRRADDPVCPISAYGRSKLAGELLALDANPATFVVRTAWLYGYRGKNFIKTMLRLARQNGRISVVADQLGNPTSANDLAHCVLALALTDAFGIYHATGEGTCSWFDLACAAVDLAGVPCEKEPLTSAEYKRRFPASADRPAYSSLDSSKLGEVAGVRPRKWDAAVKTYMENLGELGD